MILSTAILSFALAAQAAHKEPPHHRESFVILLRHHLRSLDPGVAYDQNSYSIVANLYEPIIAFDGAQDRFKPWLATAVPTKANGLLSADGRTYRFPLRSGVRFHEGETLTAEDARYSLLREMLIETPGHSSSLLLRPLLGVDSALDAEGRWGLEQASVERAVRVEGGELVFELKKPFPGFLAMLAAWPAVMPKSWALAQGDWDGRIPKPGEPRLAASESLRFHANGTGAYRLVRSTGDGREAWFERFDGYWGPAPDIGKVYVRSEPHDAIRAALLRDGEADYAYVDGSDLAALGAEKDIKIETGIPNYATGETMFLTLALDGKDNSRLGSGLLDGAGIPPDFFKEPQVRQAFALSFDFDAYNREALGGYGKHAGGPIAETLLPGKVAPPYPYDLAKAKKLFKGAYGGLLWKRGFRLVMAYPRGLPRRQAALEILKRGVEAVNPAFHVDIEGMHSGDFEREAFSHRLPVSVISLSPDYPDPHAIAFEFFHSKGLFPRAQAFADPELDRLEEEAAAEPDPAARVAKYIRLEELAGKRAYQIYTDHHPHVRAHCVHLRGVEGDHTMGGLGFANLLYWPSLSRD